MSPQPRALTVGDRMALDPIVIQGAATLTEAALLLDRHHISGAPVVDGAGSLIGVISQTDLARARATEYLWANWPGLAVRHLMTSPAITVKRSTPLSQAARKMERHRIHRLVVVADEDEALPIGILSMTDLVHAIAEEHEAAERAQATPPSAAPPSAVSEPPAPEPPAPSGPAGAEGVASA